MIRERSKHIWDEMFSPKDWWKLDLAMRSRWWLETNYDRTPPSAELVALIRNELRMNEA
jgi:hypothetical protein